MDFDGRLFPDDVPFDFGDIPVDFFRRCAECENGIEKLMEYWEQISVMDSLYLQVHVRSMEWIPMLELFLEQWGEDCATADLHRCYEMVLEEQPTFMEHVEERYRDVKGIRNHREWIESPNPPFPQDLFYRNLWIPRVEAFIRKWTSDYVPDDVKRSLAEARERYPIDR